MSLIWLVGFVCLHFKKQKKTCHRCQWILVRKSCTLIDRAELGCVEARLLNYLVNLNQQCTVHMGLQWKLLVQAALRLKPGKFSPSDSTTE